MRIAFSFFSNKRLFLVYSLPLIVGVTLMLIFDVLERPNLFFCLAGSFFPASVGEKLISGDGVKTYHESEARVDISFNSASGAVSSRITRTTPNTIWRLGNFAVGDTTGEAARPIKIVTPAGTASPRSTWLSVQYDAKKGVIEVQCFRGICELENGFGKQIMTDEEKSAATAKSAPSIPVLMTKSELIDFAGLPKP